jgi:hypothetical protein
MSLRPLLILSPIIAEAFAKAGLTKDVSRRRLFADARIPARQFERYVSDWTGLLPRGTRLVDLVRTGSLPPVFAESDDPDCLVPIPGRADDIMIVVAGDPLRKRLHVRLERHARFPDDQADHAMGCGRERCSRPRKSTRR